MDAMDILGALLGRKSSGGSAGGNILKDMLGGSKPKASTQTRRAPQPQRQGRPKTIGDAARSLEDLLNVSTEHHNSRQRQEPQRQEPQRQAPRQQAPPARTPEHESMNEQSEVLVRAMVNASKSDGQVSESEQQEILKRLDHVTQEEIDFLRAEFKRPLDVREFAWSVPLGMEEQVYALSIVAIDLDENKEANYLGDLAHGLRLEPSRCNAIHRKYGAPEIFQES